MKLLSFKKFLRVSTASVQDDIKAMWQVGVLSKPVIYQILEQVSGESGIKWHTYSSWISFRKLFLTGSNFRHAFTSKRNVT